MSLIKQLEASIQKPAKKFLWLDNYIELDVVEACLLGRLDVVIPTHRMITDYSYIKSMRYRSEYWAELHALVILDPSFKKMGGTYTYELILDKRSGKYLYHFKFTTPCVMNVYATYRDKSNRVRKVDISAKDYFAIQTNQEFVLHSDMSNLDDEQKTIRRLNKYFPVTPFNDRAKIKATNIAYKIWDICKWTGGAIGAIIFAPIIIGAWLLFKIFGKE